MRVLITGGSGFVGTNLVEHFLRRGDEVISIDVAPPRNPAHAAIWKQVDICNQKILRNTIETISPNLVFHMAARTDLAGRGIDDYSANVDGVRNVIESLISLPSLHRVVFASSMLVCRLGYRPKGDRDYNPTTAYGESKVEAERLVHSLAGKLPWVMVRPTSLWGPWFGIPYRNFFDAVRAGWYIHPKGVCVRRSYGFILNSVVQLERLAIAEISTVSERTFYLADYEPIEIRAWAESIRQAFHAPAVKDASLLFLQMAALAGDVLRFSGVRNPPLTSFRLRNLMTEAVMDLSPLEKICGSVPFESARGVEITTKWILGQK